MRSRLKITGAAIGGLCIASLIVARIVYPPPQLVADGWSHDFGEIAGGSPPEHEFAIRNGGGRPLLIKEVHSSCSCTQAQVTKSVLAPGETATLTVSLRPDSEFGRISGRILVRSNDPEGPEALFRITARNTPPTLRLSPPTIDFGQVAVGQAAGEAREFTLYCQNDEDIEVAVFDSLPESPVHVELERTDSWPNVLARLDESVSSGPLTGTVRISTRSGDASPLTLTVRGEVTGPVRADPDRVHFGEVALDATATREVRLVAESGTAVSASVLEITGGGREFVDAVVDSSDGQCLVRISVTPQRYESRNQPLTPIVRLRCGGNGGSELNVPLRFFAGR